MKSTITWCTGCTRTVQPTLTDGREIYPHREDLYSLKFWKCKTCKNFVGAHRGTNKPLGSIPTPELKEWRKVIHKTIDPLWESGGMSRTKLYKKLSGFVGKPYHTAEVNSVDEAKKILEYVGCCHSVQTTI